MATDRGDQLFQFIVAARLQDSDADRTNLAPEVRSKCLVRRRCARHHRERQQRGQDLGHHGSHHPVQLGCDTHQAVALDIVRQGPKVIDMERR